MMTRPHSGLFLQYAVSAMCLVALLSSCRTYEQAVPAPADQAESLNLASSRAEDSLRTAYAGVVDEELRRAEQQLQIPVRMSHDSRAMLDGLIDEGIDRLQAAPATREQLYRAETNLRLLVAEMVERGERVLWEDSGEPGVRIGEATFNNASSGLCPLYPFC